MMKTKLVSSQLGNYLFGTMNLKCIGFSLINDAKSPRVLIFGLIKVLNQSNSKVLFLMFNVVMHYKRYRKHLTKISL